MKALSKNFYTRDDVVGISRELIGKVLVTTVGGVVTSAIITETEAYAGIVDRASHAYGDRRTARTEPMYAEGGTAYVYLCYCIHHLFNVVTGRAGTPHAVLVRAGVPLQGLETMLVRRGSSVPRSRLLSGPGSLAKALGITTALTGTGLIGGVIRIESHGFRVAPSKIVTGPRVGVDYAGADALLPYRFRVDPADVL
jgi:DNA-3-methyladenine glycosylase